VVLPARQLPATACSSRLCRGSLLDAGLDWRGSVRSQPAREAPRSRDARGARARGPERKDDHAQPRHRRIVRFPNDRRRKCRPVCILAPTCYPSLANPCFALPGSNDSLSRGSDVADPVVLKSGNTDDATPGTFPNLQSTLAPGWPAQPWGRFLKLRLHASSSVLGMSDPSRSASDAPRPICPTCCLLPIGRRACCAARVP